MNITNKLFVLEISVTSPYIVVQSSKVYLVGFVNDRITPAFFKKLSGLNGKVRPGQILVDNPTATYVAGSEVTGTVVLILDKPKRVRGVQIKIDGSATVSWREYDNKSFAEEEYFSTKHFLFGSETSEKEIPAGKTEYPFSTTLPPGLPTSFEGGHGYIRYTIRAILDRPWKKDEETKLFITVITPINLNDVPKVKDPILKETSTSYCCLCCKSGPLTLASFIPYSGFVPGQTIVITVDVDNASNVRVSAVRCKLTKEIKWIIKQPKYFERVSKLDLAEFGLGEVPPHTSKAWSQNIEIPQMPVLNLEACTIIKVQFYLEVIAVPSGGYKDLEMKFPITLGTVPLTHRKSVGTALKAFHREEDVTDLDEK